MDRIEGMGSPVGARRNRPSACLRALAHSAPTAPPAHPRLLLGDVLDSVTVPARCAELHKAILAVKTSAAAGAGLEPDDLNAAVVAALTEWSEGYARTVVDAINEHLFKLLSVQWKDVQSRLYNGAYVRGEGGQVVLKRLMRKIATLAVPMYKEAPRAIADALSNTATAEPAQSSDDDDAGHDVLGLTEQLRAVPDKVRAGAGGGRGGRAGRGRAAKPTTHPRSRRSPRRSPSRALLSRPA